MNKTELGQIIGVLICTTLMCLSFVFDVWQVSIISLLGLLAIKEDMRLNQNEH